MGADHPSRRHSTGVTRAHQIATQLEQSCAESTNSTADCLSKQLFWKSKWTIWVNRTIILRCTVQKKAR